MTKGVIFIKRRIMCIILTLCIFSSLALSSCSFNKTPDAIIILPGIMGSEIFDSSGEKLWLDTDSPNGIISVLPKLQLLKYTKENTFKTASPIINDPQSETNYGTFNTYKSLYNTVYDVFKEKADVVFFSYDWRLNPYFSAKELDEFINERQYGKVTLIAHSMGGIVASQYIALGKDQQRSISKLITLGTPYLGSTLASQAMLSGNVLGSLAGSFISPAIKEICPAIPALYALLPFEQNWSASLCKDGVEMKSYAEEIELLRSSVNGWNEEFYNEAYEYNKLMFTDKSHITQKVDSYYIVGDGEETTCIINILSDGSFKYEKSNSGDGTVSYHSATIGNTANKDFLYVKYSSDSKSALHGDLVGGDDMTTPIFVTAIINNTHIEYDNLSLRESYGLTQQPAKK